MKPVVKMICINLVSALDGSLMEKGTKRHAIIPSSMGMSMSGTSTVKILVRPVLSFLYIQIDMVFSFRAVRRFLSYLEIIMEKYSDYHQVQNRIGNSIRGNASLFMMRVVSPYSLYDSVFLADR